MLVASALRFLFLPSGRRGNDNVSVPGLGAWAGFTGRDGWNMSGSPFLPLSVRTLGVWEGLLAGEPPGIHALEFGCLGP